MAANKRSEKSTAIGANVAVAARKPTKNTNAGRVSQTPKGTTKADKRSTNDESSKRKYLTQAQLEMTCTELMDHLMCSKATAWRAKRNGFYCPGYNGNAQSRETKRNALARLQPLQQLPPPGTRIRLTAIERRLSRNALADRYRIGHALASEALRKGTFKMPAQRRRLGTTTAMKES